MAGSQRLQRLRQQMAATPIDDDTDAQIRRLETAISRRDRAQRALLRQIEHLRGCIEVLEAEARTLGAETAGLDKALQALFEDVLDKSGMDWQECWSPVPVLGFRLWSVHPDGLHGAKLRWSSRYLEARCLPGMAGQEGIPHSNQECGQPPCGIYATKTLESLTSHIGEATEMALGLVGLSGRVVEHENGYRAERAEVLALAVVHRTSLLTPATTGDIDDVFASTGDEIRARCRPAEHALGEAVAYLKQQARRHQQWTSASNSE